jgi:serine O-acetyltransferase
MEEKFIQALFREHQECKHRVPPELVYNWIDDMLEFLFPQFSNKHFDNLRAFELHYKKLKLSLFNLLNRLPEPCRMSTEEVEMRFFDHLPEIKVMLLEDAKAILAGDPASINLSEVIQTYPGFYAIAIHRFAHTFLRLEIPALPRILTEYAHRNTGIDIHPGAQIGRRFCMDHGTGIVIGETVEIGDDVKIYQGVTLGAMSVQKEFAKTKRHPTIENNVVIYSGATILGGDTVIGENSVIGGNVWITKSVPANSRVYYQREKSTQQH